MLIDATGEEGHGTDGTYRTYGTYGDFGIYFSKSSFLSLGMMFARQ